MRTTSDHRPTPVELSNYKEAASPDAAVLTFTDRGWDPDLGRVRPDFDPSKTRPVTMSIPDSMLTQEDHDHGIAYFAALERAAGLLIEEAKADPVRLTEQINAAEAAKLETARLTKEAAEIQLEIDRKRAELA